MNVIKKGGATMNKSILGVDRSAQLRHWKYIKKKRGKNGKWIYYYDKKSLKSDFEKIVGIDARRKRDHAELLYNVSNINSQKSKNTYNEAKYEVMKDGKITSQERKSIDEYGRQRYKDYVSVRNTGRSYISAKSAYLNTPLGKVEAAIKSGKSFIRNLFVKVGKGN